MRGMPRALVLALAAAAAAAGAMPGTARAASHPLSGGGSITDAELSTIRGRLTPIGVEFLGYHWTTFANCFRLAAQGFVSEGEMDFLTLPENGVNEAAGGGFYVAADPTSSSSFGECLLEATFPAQTLVCSWTVLSQVVPRLESSNNQIRVDVGKLLGCMNEYNTADKWNVVYSASLTKHIRLSQLPLSGARLYTYVAALEQGAAGVATQLDARRAQALRDAAGYFNSLFWLMYYMDPISLLRAVRVRPDNPWAEFEPEHFEQFRSTRQRMLERAVGTIDGANGTVCAGRVFRGGVDGELTRTYLPSVASGLSQGADSQYRDAPVRAGGDQPGHTFLATGPQADQLFAAAGKRLTPTCVEAPETGGPGTHTYRCSYLYPDAAHCSGLPTYCPPSPTSKPGETRNVVTETTHAVFRDIGGACGNPDLGVPPAVLQPPPGGDNTKLVRQYPGVGYLRNSGVVTLMQNLVGAHPFGDFNGRTTRAVAQTAAVEAGFPMPVALVGDMDLLERADAFAAHVDSTARQLEDLQRQMLARLFEVLATEQRKADGPRDYFALKNKWTDLYSALADLGVSSPARELSAAQLELVRQRRWVELFDTLGGMWWSTFRSTKCKHCLG